VPQSILGDGTIRRLWKPLFCLDRADARVGQQWTREEKTPDPALGVFTVTFHQELRGVKDGVADIGVTADCTLTPAIGPGAAKALLVSSTIAGSYEWDVAHGTLKSWTATQENTLDIEKGGEKQNRQNKISTSLSRMDADAPAKPAPAPGTTKP